MVLRKLNLGKLGKGKLKDVFQPRKDKLYWDYHGSRIDLNRNATGEDAFCPSVTGATTPTCTPVTDPDLTTVPANQSGL